MTSYGAKRGPKLKPLPETLDKLTAELVAEMRTAAEASRVSMRKAANSAGYSHGTLQRLLAGRIYPISGQHVDAFLLGYGLDRGYWWPRYLDYVRQSTALADLRRGRRINGAGGGSDPGSPNWARPLVYGGITALVGILVVLFALWRWNRRRR